MYDLDNERKLNPVWRKDGMTEGRKGVTLYALAILWRGHLNFNHGFYLVMFATRQASLSSDNSYPFYPL